jgi:hypothetical protein
MRRYGFAERIMNPMCDVPFDIGIGRRARMNSRLSVKRPVGVDFRPGALNRKELRPGNTIKC